MNLISQQVCWNVGMVWLDYWIQTVRVCLVIKLSVAVFKFWLGLEWMYKVYS